MAADLQSTYTVSLFGSTQGDDRRDGSSPSRIQTALVDFVMDFHLDNVFIYRYAEW
jgi:DNA replication licensing factor MCM5